MRSRRPRITRIKKAKPEHFKEQLTPEQVDECLELSAAWSFDTGNPILQNWKFHQFKAAMAAYQFLLKMYGVSNLKRDSDFIYVRNGPKIALLVCYNFKLFKISPAQWDFYKNVHVTSFLPVLETEHESFDMYKMIHLKEPTKWALHQDDDRNKSYYGRWIEHLTRWPTVLSATTQMNLKLS